MGASDSLGVNSVLLWSMTQVIEFLRLHAPEASEAKARPPTALLDCAIRETMSRLGQKKRDRGVRK